MSDHISREEAIDNLCESCFIRNCSHDCDAIKAIRGTKPADVRPVIHGEWRGEYDECSICGRAMSELIDAWSYFGSGIEDVRFCPWCGSDMRGETDGN